MVNAVKELESGTDTDTAAHDHDVSKVTLYNWKSKYSGMETSQVECLHELKAENRRLKQMCAEIALDNKILKEVLGQLDYNVVRPHDAFFLGGMAPVEYKASLVELLLSRAQLLFDPRCNHSHVV